jgi:NADH-quinone oxidoreductase subunit E
MQELSEQRVRSILAARGDDPQQLVAALLDIQEASCRSFVDRTWAELTARVLGVPLTRVHEILTFYHMLATEPRGRHVIEICESAPCHFKGAGDLLSWFEEELGIRSGETSPDGLFTIERCSCMGLCDKSPAVRVGELSLGGLTREGVARLVAGLRGAGAGRGGGS